MNFFDKKASGSGVTTLANKSTIKYMPQNEQFTKPIIRKFKKEEFIQHLKTIFGVLI